MTNLHAELRVTLTENGIPDASPLLEYMDWAGIRTKNSLAMFFTDTDKIIEWIEKFQNEITFGTPEKKIHFPEDDRRKGLYKLASSLHGTYAETISTQPDRASSQPPARHHHQRPQQQLPAPRMTKYRKHGPKESTNNSSQITEPAPVTPDPSPKRYSSAPRRSSSGCGTSTPPPKTIRLWALEKSSPTAPSLPPAQSTTPPSGTSPTRPSSLIPNTTHLYTKNKKTGTPSR